MYVAITKMEGSKREKALQKRRLTKKYRRMIKLGGKKNQPGQTKSLTISFRFSGVPYFMKFCVLSSLNFAVIMIF